MTRAEKLNILELLSALESWGFSTNALFPDYLHDQITSAMELLRKEILEG